MWPEKTKIRIAGGKDEGADIKNIHGRKRRGLGHGWAIKKKAGLWGFHGDELVGPPWNQEITSLWPHLASGPLTVLIHSSQGCAVLFP